MVSYRDEFNVTTGVVSSVQLTAEQQAERDAADAAHALGDLARAKSTKCAAVDALYDAVTTFSWGGYTWQCHHDARDDIGLTGQWAVAAISAGAQAGDFTWHGGVGNYQGITSDNQLVNMDAFNVRDRAIAMGQKLQAARANGRNHKNAINALNTVATVEAYDISTGWPA